VSAETVLVTGVAGFIGSHVADRLLAEGRRVVGVDDFCDYYDPAVKRANVADKLDRPEFTLLERDIRDAAAVTDAFETHRPDAVIHLAAMANVRYSIGRAPLYTAVNVVGSVNLLEEARKHGADPFVFASTSSIYGRTEELPFVETDPCNRPLAPYPATKKAVEALGFTYHNLHGMNFTALRFFSVYGPRGRPDMMPFMVMDRIVRGDTITLFDAGRMKRDWTYVEDIVSGVVAAVDRPQGALTVNLGRGEPVLMSDFVTLIEELVGRPAVLETPEAPASEPKVTYARIDRARKTLGYAPRTPVGEGLERMWVWYRSRKSIAAG
jgi:UDP-glucuronate 4-epimerase